jgi:hypothetical protein
LVLDHYHLFQLPVTHNLSSSSEPPASFLSQVTSALPSLRRYRRHRHHQQQTNNSVCRGQHHLHQIFATIYKPLTESNPFHTLPPFSLPAPLCLQSLRCFVTSSLENVRIGCVCS